MINWLVLEEETAGSNKFSTLEGSYLSAVIYAKSLVHYKTHTKTMIKLQEGLSLMEQ